MRQTGNCRPEGLQRSPALSTSWWALKSARAWKRSRSIRVSAPFLPQYLGRVFECRVFPGSLDWPGVLYPPDAASASVSMLACLDQGPDCSECAAARLAEGDFSPVTVSWGEQAAFSCRDGREILKAQTALGIEENKSLFFMFLSIVIFMFSTGKDNFFYIFISRFKNKTKQNAPRNPSYFSFHLSSSHFYSAYVYVWIFFKFYWRSSWKA